MINEAFTAVTADDVRIVGVRQRPARASDSEAGVVVVAHPHPLYGGDMWNPVVDAVCRAASNVGWTTLRFDFRGVGESSGRHGGGTEERLDVTAVIDHADSVDRPGRIVLAGYSFGALTSLGVVHPRIERWVAVAPPLVDVDPPAADDPRPKTLLVPEHDQFCPPDRAERARSWPNSGVEVLTGADHFLNGRLALVTAAVERILAISP